MQRIYSFENADFDYNNPQTENGMYEFDDPTCTECGKQFHVVQYHVVISFDENGDLEVDIESVCMTQHTKHGRKN
ncbi:hypothetical protein HNO89_003300 [Sporosarcina luteola]|nr:hypothetical protein [Sporosarcina luteola]